MRKVPALCHIHSDWSYDGKWPLDKLARVFGHLGIQVLLTTEHHRGFDEVRWNAYRRACKKASTNRVKIVPGIEYSDDTNTVHILVLGSIPFLGSALETNVLLESVAQHKGFAVLAHPGCKQAWEKLEASGVKHLFGIEVWNRRADGFAPSQKAIELLSCHDGLLPFVGLDFHCGKQLFPLLMVIELQGTVTQGNVLESLRSRRLYPSILGLDLSRYTSKPGYVLAKWSERMRRSALSSLRAVMSKASQLIQPLNT